MWGRMRMSPRDIADVTGSTYTYLMNGRDSRMNWSGLFKPGEKSAPSYYKRFSDELSMSEFLAWR